jgi:hypothetical protein
MPMKTLSLFTLLILSLMTVGCGQKAENQVNVTISQGLLFGGASLVDYSQGGLMLWGSSDTGQSFAHALRGSDQLNLNLPNGQWSFFAMAWQNANGIELDATEKLRCATTAAGLNGGDSQIDLTLAEATCTQNIFSNGMGTNFPTMRYQQYVCENITGYGVGKNCSRDRNIAGGWISDPVPVMSVLIRLAEHSSVANLAPGAGLSRCLSFDASLGQTSLTAPSELVFPISMNPVFKLEFEYHLDTTDCTSASSKVISPSVAQNSPRIGLNQTVAGIFNHFKQITDAQLCAEGRQNLPGFAGGVGTDLHPYMICSSEQLYNLSQNWATYAASSFRLAKSIDLLPFIKANYSQNISLPSDYLCWSEGTNWRPLGWNYDEDCNKTTPIEFSGSFDGNNHSIINLRAEHEEETHIGFFSHWAPANTDQFIRDIKFIQPSLEGGQYIGTLVGQKMPSVSTFIQNIHVVDGSLEARSSGAGTISYIGGVLGAGDWLGLVNVSTKNTDIVHAKDYAGGVFGSIMDALAVTKVFSSSTIINSGSNGMSSYVGGIGGFLDGGSITELSLLSHEGAIIGLSDKVGGLFGATASLGSPGTLAHAYATTSITNDVKTAVELPGGVGGLIGYIGGPLNLNGTYFAGHMLSSCAGVGCPIGLVFGRRSGGAVNGEVYVYETPSRTIVNPGDSAPSPAFTKTIFNNSTTTSPSLYIPANSPNLGEPFDKPNNALPRLKAQKHPCVQEPSYIRQDLTTQLSLGHGFSATDPLKICHKEQFEQITSLPPSPTLYIELMAPINLVGTYTPVHIKSNIVLDGYKGLLYGFDQTTTALALMERRAPIAINEGEIYDLNIAGINIGAPSSLAANTISSFVHTNSGLIHNGHVLSSVLTSSNLDTNLSGFVAENTLSGFIFESSSQTRFYNTQATASGFAHFNFGTIAEVTVEPLFDVIAATSTSSNTSGIFFQNNGTIKKAELRAQISNDSNAVVQNLWGLGKMNNGVITDSLIDQSTHLSTNLSAGNFATVVENNSSNATITRVINEGTFLNTNNTTNTQTYPDAQAVKTNDGNIDGIFSTRPAGRQISYGVGSTDFNCSGNDVLIYNTMFSSLEIGIPTIGSLPYTWLETRGPNNEFSLYRVIDFTPSSANVLATLEGVPCDISQFNNTDTKIRFIQSYASNLEQAEGNATEDDFVGVIQPQLLDQSFFTTGPWAGEFLDPDNDLADLDLIVAAYMERAINGTSTITIPPWEFEEGTAPDENNRMRLLRFD